MIKRLINEKRPNHMQEMIWAFFSICIDLKEEDSKHIKADILLSALIC